MNAADSGGDAHYYSGNVTKLRHNNNYCDRKEV